MRGLALVLLVLASVPCARAAVLTTKEAVLEEVFPGARIERARTFLSEEEAERVAQAAGTALESRAVIAWSAHDDTGLLGTAYLERHLVRTLPESILVLLSPKAEVLRIEVLTFEEPRDYLPPDRWLAQFDGEPLSDELRLKRRIRGLSGATLSGRAVTDATRRVLAVHELLTRRGAATTP